MLQIKPEDLIEIPYILLTPDDIETYSTDPRNGHLIITVDDVEGVSRVPSTAPNSQQLFGELSDLELRMLELINADRITESLSGSFLGQLQWSSALCKVARAHSKDMVDRGYMSHLTLEGLSPMDRLSINGIRFAACAENLAGTPTRRQPTSNGGPLLIYTGFLTIQAAQQGLMNSPGHRNNILNPVFSHVGVGIARNHDETLVITQLFAKLQE